MAYNQGFALIIGVANYHSIRNLPHSIMNDANQVTQTLVNPEQCGYLPENVKTLINQEATLDNIQFSLKWLADQAPKSGTVMIYFSGHGGRLENGINIGNYLLPYDAQLNNLSQTALGGSDFTALIKKIKAERIVVFFDCCYAGGIGEIKSMESTVFKEGFKSDFYDELKKGAGRVIIASSRADEVSLAYSDLENSLFTHFLLRALAGEAYNSNDGSIRILHVFDFLSTEIPAYDSRQHPVIKAEAEKNFAIALYKGGDKSGATRTTLKDPKTGPTNIRTGDTYFNKAKIKNSTSYISSGDGDIIINPTKRKDS